MLALIVHHLFVQKINVNLHVMYKDYQIIKMDVNVFNQLIVYLRIVLMIFVLLFQTLWEVIALMVLIVLQEYV